MKRLAILLLAIAAAVVASISYVGMTMNREITISGDELLYEIPLGATLTSIVSDLSERSIWNGSGLVFRLYSRATQSEGHIKAGEYALRPGMTGHSLLALFRSGKVVERQLTFVEGWTFEQWREYLREQAHIEQTTSALGAADIMALLGEPGLPAEGQFFPDTYHYTKGESDLSILRRAHERMKVTLAQEWAHGTQSAALPTSYDALVLASIVEKETGAEADRETIASVFVNRLAKGMRLQSDPTVIYGVPNFDGDLTSADLSRQTGFNTYVIKGLPPTPICNPGLASIRATMNPAFSNYYYFVARGDGTSEFSETLEEHNAAVTRYQKAGRVKNYRSAPVEP